MSTEKKDPVEAKITHQQLAHQALELHKSTGGAPIEISDGTRKVKIGPWLPPEIRSVLAEIMPGLARTLGALGKPAPADEAPESRN